MVSMDLRTRECDRRLSSGMRGPGGPGARPEARQAGCDPLLAVRQDQMLRFMRPPAWPVSSPSIPASSRRLAAPVAPGWWLGRCP